MTPSPRDAGGRRRPGGSTAHMISIIIRARNEEDHLGTTLAYLREHAPETLAEIIVAAGESLDAAAEVARPWAAVVHGPDSARAALMEDELDVGQAFRNPHERIKLEMERTIRTACEAHEIPLTIFRPSIGG